VYALARRGNNEKKGREKGIFMALDKLEWDAVYAPAPSSVVSAIHLRSKPIGYAVTCLMFAPETVGFVPHDNDDRQRSLSTSNLL